MEEDLPGINGEFFKVTLHKSHFNNLKFMFRVKSKCRYQWYWRILYYLTFRRYFNIYYTLELTNNLK